MYLTSDGRWLVLCLLYDQWWPDLARTVGRDEWLEDSRYAEVENRLANNVSEGCKTTDSNNSCRVAMGQTFPCFQLLLPAR